MFPPPINEFKDEYRFLSNFWLCQITYDGLLFKSTEHAYQAAKSHDFNERVYISKLSTPGECRKYGRAIKHLRENWDEVRLPIMYELLCQKFSRHPDLAKKLIKTFPRHIEEGNWWNDTYWGVCKGKGQNNLGKLLMLVRHNLMAASGLYEIQSLIKGCEEKKGSDAETLKDIAKIIGVELKCFTL